VAGAGHSGLAISRRAIIGSAAAAAVAAAGGVGVWSIRRSRDDHAFNELMDLGKQAQLYGDRSNKSAEYFQQAAARRPDSGTAQGLVALTQAAVAEDGSHEAGAALQRADRAAQAALAIDPREPNARLALVTLQRSTLDLATNEDRIREILAIDPKNISAMVSLWSLLQSAGRSRDALALIERANSIEPYAASIQFPKAQLLWILGRTAEADRVIDRAVQYWPEHQVVRFARFTIYAYTGRPRAALAMLDDGKMTPFYTPAAISLWRVSLAALDQRSSASIAAARSANLQAANRDPRLTNQAVLVLSALGQLDAAFDVANQLLLFRHPVEPHSTAGSTRSPVKSTSWRFAPWLFTPPAEPMQSDPRFNALCEGIGLTDYWAKRRIEPDYQLRNN
jgi:tetratricopeptide (TPR) repeat protein